MPYYAVTYKHLSYSCGREATEAEVAKWKEEHPDEEPKGKLMVRTMMVDGSDCHLHGPFKSAKRAWIAVGTHHEPKMFGSFPFIFKYGRNQNMKALFNKIEDDQFERQYSKRTKRTCRPPALRFTKRRQLQ